MAAESQRSTWPTFVCGATAGCESTFLQQKAPLSSPHWTVSVSPSSAHQHSVRISAVSDRVRRFKSRHPSLIYVTAVEKCARATSRHAHPRACTKRSPSMTSLETALLWLTGVPINHRSPGGGGRYTTNWTDGGGAQRRRRERKEGKIEMLRFTRKHSSHGIHTTSMTCREKLKD